MASALVSLQWLCASALSLSVYTILRHWWRCRRRPGQTSGLPSYICALGRLLLLQVHRGSNRCLDQASWAVLLATPTITDGHTAFMSKVLILYTVHCEHMCVRLWWHVGHSVEGSGWWNREGSEERQGQLETTAHLQLPCNRNCQTMETGQVHRPFSLPINPYICVRLLCVRYKKPRQ